jgi:hypothetical protein
MTYQILDWLHVLVMGYWIGSDLVVNQLTHYITRASQLPGRERQRLWDFLLDVDQHPRNALILSVPIGFSLAAMLGLSPIVGPWLLLLWLASAAWFGFMWLVHWRRHEPSGKMLGAWDWRFRYLLIAAFALTGIISLVRGEPFTSSWLAWKLILFAGVLACGIGIRYYIRLAYGVLPAIAADRAGERENGLFRDCMRRATWVLWLLWAQLLAIALLGVIKPTL